MWAGREYTTGTAAAELDQLPEGAALAAEDGGVTAELTVEPAMVVLPAAGTSTISVSAAEAKGEPMISPRRGAGKQSDERA